MAKKNKTNLRGAAKQSTALVPYTGGGASKKEKTQKQTQKKQSQAPMRVAMAPVSIGTSLRSSTPKMTRVNGNVRISARSYITSVAETNNTSWFLGAMVPINPLYFDGLPAGRLAGTYKKYRFASLQFHYITRQPTTAAGEVIMAVNNKVSGECLAYSTSSFLPQAMSYQDCLMGPVWTNHTLNVTSCGGWYDVDCLSNNDFEDALPGELYVWVQSALTDTVGYIVADYVLEFSTLDLGPRSVGIPYSPGLASIVSLVDTANPAVGNFPTVTIPAAYAYNTTTRGFGATFRIVLDMSTSTLTAPITASTAWQLLSGALTENVALVDGTTIYGVINSTTGMRLYPTLEGAITGSTNFLFQYRTAAAAPCTYSATMYPVGWGSAFKL